MASIMNWQTEGEMPCFTLFKCEVRLFTEHIEKMLINIPPEFLPTV